MQLLVRLAILPAHFVPTSLFKVFFFAPVGCFALASGEIISFHKCKFLLNVHFKVNRFAPFTYDK